MVRKVVTWVDDRLGASRFTRDVLAKVFPDHWSFLLGEIALYCFVILVLTGVFLSFFFEPSVAESVYRGEYEPLQGVVVSDAYRSVMDLSFEVRAGMVMRQIHHWAALVFLAAIVVHLVRIFFTGAYRRPREINWMIGLTLLTLAMFNGFTGYSLPDDLLSGTGLRIAYSIALSIPVIGTWMAFLVFGGEFPAEQIINRLFVIHIFIIPVLIAGLLTAHMALIWRQKHTQFPGGRRREENVVGERLWPTYAAKSMGLFFGVFGILALLGGLVQINPIWLYGPFKPAQVPSPAQPDWYMGWLEGALRLFPAWEITTFGYEIPNPFFPAVLLPGITFTLLYLWPFLEAFFTSDHKPHHLLDRPRDRPMRTALGTATLSFYFILFAAASNDLLAKWLRVPVENVVVAYQILAFALPLATGLGTYLIAKSLTKREAEPPGAAPETARTS
ncbi:MAG: ubiquinol-cytochrome c reductase cytochrome b subunit [Actinobacteria bacterium]|nr:ubiquinol-cytochrome c reductase cytochrome b subunit [Actinomycetota bacterium]